MHKNGCMPMKASFKKAPSKRVLLLVTAHVEKIRHRLSLEEHSPKQDFDELAKALDAQILSFDDLSSNRFWSVKLVKLLLGTAPALALLGYYEKASIYFTTAENCGLVLALLHKFSFSRPQHTMIAHKLSGKFKPFFIKLFTLMKYITGVIVYSPLQKNFIESAFNFPSSKCHLISFQVDPIFFKRAPLPKKASLLSVGREFRDYPTLFEVASKLNIPLKVVASSPWSNKADETKNQCIPLNITLCKGLSSIELRQAYEEASIVIVPLKDIDSPAGITSILEAQAVGRPVILAKTSGLQHSFQHGHEVLFYSCYNQKDLYEAIQKLLNNPSLCEDIVQNAYDGIKNHRNLSQFVENIRSIVYGQIALSPQ
jgi:glycosyltransferase involved in cell wall biosynthesis